MKNQNLNAVLFVVVIVVIVLAIHFLSAPVYR